MSHPEQLKFASVLKESCSTRLRDGAILEIGSYGVNGSIRSIFSSCEPRVYTGVDLIAGPGVDVVQSGHLIRLDSDSFDLAISCECFEHNPYWYETFVNMIRMTKPCGIVAVSCASRGRIEHGTSRAQDRHASPGTAAMGSEYYRNLCEEDFREKLDFSEYFSAHRFFYIRSHRDLFFIGVKRGRDCVDADNLLNVIGAKILDIPKQRWAERGLLKSLLREAVLNVPLGVLSRFLSEETFQKVIIPYRLFLSRLAGEKGKSWLKG